MVSPALAQNLSLGTTAANFGVLGSSTVTNTGATIVSGDVGVWAGPAITGFPPGTIVPGSGALHAGDAVAQQAQSDLTAAYNAAIARVCPVANNLSGSVLGSGGTVLTLAPGVYCFDAAAQLTGDLILSGAGVYIFQIGTTLTTAAAASITLTNGASACGVWWQVGSSATLGAGSSLAGNILAFTSITMTTGASVAGGALARNGAVTLDSNQATACGPPAQPDLGTQASAGTTPGGTIGDTATLSAGVNPTGTITFLLFGPDDAACSSPAIFTSSVAVSGNGSYSSAAFTANAVGVYRWIADYDGDVNNNPVANTCNATNESVVVAQAVPDLVTTASAGVLPGSAISDSAVLSGGVNPTGTITFTLYGPNDASCTGTPVFTATTAVAGNGTYGSGNFTPTLAGIYRWIANYGGDANNAATANGCNGMNESAVVSQATPGLATTASAGVPLGNAISDNAVLSGGFNPTGTITFSLYGPNNATCTGTPAFAATIAVAGNGTYGSGNFTPASAGTYRWVANYGGDANNTATANVCNGTNESVLVSQATPSVVTTASAGGPLGGAINDNAVLSGGINPTGSITFRLYGPNDSTCSGAIISTSTVPIAGNGTYGSGNFTPTSVGTYRWIANYGGDANNIATTNSCNGANESAAVSQATPSVVTTASAGLPLGGAISDSAALSGGVSPTGTIVFRLYGPNDSACSGAIISTSTVPVAGNGSYDSGNFTPSLVGTYRWIANYGGDANNAATANACNAINENVVVSQAPTTLTTQASTGAAVGAAISDAATLAGGITPTGAITFNLYGPNNATCTGTPAFTATIAVAGNGTYGSGNFVPTSVGTYRWIANYGGDANNAATANACNGANESVVVSQATPSVATTASPGILLGGPISDAAVLSGGVNATGAILFRLYGPNDATCSGTIVFTSTIAVAGNASYGSGNFTPTSVGTYRWIANYGGDANNAATANVCNGANENTVVGQATPSVVTTASAGVPLGGIISDNAVLSNGVNPTGTITFNLYGPNNATCTGTPIFASPITVGGNGSYGSGNFTPTLVGTYRWIANYGGDANNTATANACNGANESVVIGQASPSVVTTASAGPMLGGIISDNAVLGGGVNPTGAIVFRLYGPNDSTCSGAIVFTSTIPIAGNGSYGSGNFTPTAAGTYRWIANYGGDANNAATANACNGANETVVVSQATPSVATTASAGVLLGGAISDTAILSGGRSPIGTITFTLFGPGDSTCSAVIFTSTVPVNGNGSYASTPGFTPTTAGTYRWIANYSGDANNTATGNACNGANENVLVGATAPNVATTASPSIALGKSINDMGHLSGAVNPTGTITFTLYGPNDATCSGASIFVSTVAVNGNGSYPSAFFTPSATGTYRWIANYSGDAGNAATGHACNVVSENVVVTAAIVVADIPALGDAALMLLTILLGVSGMLAAWRISQR